MARFCSSASLGGVYLCRVLKFELTASTCPARLYTATPTSRSRLPKRSTMLWSWRMSPLSRMGSTISRRLSERISARHKYTPPKDALLQNRAMGYFVDLGNSPIHVYLLPLRPVDGANSSLAVFHDASYIGAEREQIWRDTLWHVAAQVLLVVFLTFLVVRWTILLPIARTTQWIKELQM